MAQGSTTCATIGAAVGGRQNIPDTHRHAAPGRVRQFWLGLLAISTSQPDQAGCTHLLPTHGPVAAACVRQAQHIHPPTTRAFACCAVLSTRQVSRQTWQVARGGYPSLADTQCAAVVLDALRHVNGLRAPALISSLPRNGFTSPCQNLSLHNAWAPHWGAPPALWGGHPPPPPSPPQHPYDVCLAWWRWWGL
jgi:hypothetical protein